MARHDTLSSNYKNWKESYDPLVPEDLVYTGQLNLTEQLTSHALNVGKMLLSPTRSFSPLMPTIIEKHGSEIHGMVHCSGGGQTKVLHYVSDLNIIKDNLFETPPLFEMIQKQSGSAWKEMYQVFNMGNLLEFYVPENIAASIIQIATEAGIPAQIIGRVEAADTKKVSIQSAHGFFEYH
jgi:phosphoribosylformylglycinamidine cyclo-ligase